MTENDWQPVRIAPPSHASSHVHYETVRMMKANQGKIIRVRRSDPPWGSCDETFDVHPEDQHVFDGFQKAGKQTGVCICQILAD